MVERKHLTPEQKEKQIETVKKIVELTAQIKALVPEFEAKSVKTAFCNSVTNLEKKCEQHSKSGERFQVTSDEKTLLLKIRNGEIKVSEISPDVESTGSNDEKQTTSKKHGKKNN